MVLESVDYILLTPLPLIFLNAFHTEEIYCFQLQNDSSLQIPVQTSSEEYKAALKVFENCIGRANTEIFEKKTARKLEAE